MLYRFYKIYSDIDDEICYIGKTIQELNKRFIGHKSKYINKKLCCYSKKVFEKYGIENCKIELLEELYFENKYSADLKEREYIENYKNCINKLIPSRNRKERNEINKDKYKEWYEDNKQRIKEKNKDYYSKNKDLISEKYSHLYICDLCKKELRIDGKKRHEKSKLHKNNLLI